MQSFTLSSNRISQTKGKAFPPKSYIYLAAVYIVPYNLGCGSAVFAKIPTLAPSFAKALAIAKPIPLEPPVTTTVLFLNGLLLDILFESSCNLCIYYQFMIRYKIRVNLIKIKVMDVKTNQNLLNNNFVYTKKKVDYALLHCLSLLNFQFVLDFLWKFYIIYQVLAIQNCFHLF